MASKVVVLGDVNGQLQPAFNKLATLQAKNAFNFAIVAGNLFSADGDGVTDLLDGKVTIPLPTYFTVGTNPLPQRIIDKIEADEEICENLHFLGKRSTTKTSEGIRIVTLGGSFDKAAADGLSKDQYLPFHSVADAKALHGANTADILLTTCWPTGVTKGSRVINTDNIVFPSELQHIAELCATLKPRYHFSASPESSFEREPFFHNPMPDKPDFRPVTRFISLCAHGKSKPNKFLYGFTLPAQIDEKAPLPSGVTSSPFLTVPGGPRKRPLDPDPYSRFGHHDGYSHSKRGRGRKGARQPPPGPGECFFCLSNPNLATHLISSIGDDAYLTIAKGPLTTSKTYSQYGVSFQTNAIIIPLTHAATIAAIPADDDNAREKTYHEMNRFKEALQRMVAAKSDNKLGAVTYEISKGNGIHTHWQFIAMTADTISKGLVEAAFRVEAENLQYPSFEARDPGIGANDGDLFRAWIWTPPDRENPTGSTRCITMAFDDSIRFSLQFGRTVLAKLLSLEKRIQWRDCVQDVEEETQESEAFKAAFKKFDFTI